MPAVSTQVEYDLVRLAIQAVQADASATGSFTLGSLSVSYNAQQLPILQAREIELARRLSQRNIRKRTSPDFS